MSISLAKAEEIVEAALAKGHELKFEPLTVAVLDAGGHLVALKREDRSGILRPDIAIGKAWGALGMGFGSRELGERAVKVPHFMNALMAASHGRFVPVPGGVLILEGGDVLGAVGISGDTSDNDEICCLAGVAAAGYVGQTGFRPPE
ncbi:MAG: heme-binding protein [Pseudomonadota bacterium]